MLGGLAASRTAALREVERAKVLLAYADGKAPTEIQRLFGVSRPTIYKWIDKVLATGVVTRAGVVRAGQERQVVLVAAQQNLAQVDQPAHSFATLMAEMATIVRNTCRTPSADPDAPTFELLTAAPAHQQRALALIQAIRP